MAQACAGAPRGRSSGYSAASGRGKGLRALAPRCNKFDVRVRRAGRTSDPRQSRSLEEAARMSRENVPNDGGIKKHGGSMSEGLASYQGHFPVEDRAFEYLPSAKVRRESASLAPGTQTEAREIFNTGRWTRPLRQEYSKQGMGAGERVSSPADAMMQASVVAGIMARRDELSFFPVVQGFEHHELRQATQKSSTRGSVSVKSRHEPVPQPKGQSASRPERFLTLPSPVCFLRPRASRSSSRGRGVGLFFLWCAPSFSSLLSFFRAGFPGVV